ncbi:MAG: patatin-like phospholipase family protein [Caldilineaceae bacterium]
MRAFVLSGGANLGPIQVGALRALFEQQIFPTMLVGCSAGALNAAYLARAITLAQVEHLAHVWRDVKLRDIYPEHRVGALWRLFSGQDSFYSNRNFYAFLQRHGATPAHTFGQTTIPLYITATHLHTGRLHVFGDNPNDRILDAMMASTALTPLLPPWEVDGERYIDGGTVTPLPLRVALERGASEIYSLHITSGDPDENHQVLYRGIASLLIRSVDTMLGLQAEHDLLLIKHQRKVRLHHLRLKVADPPAPTDFSQVERLIDSGYAQTKEFLAKVAPQRVPQPKRQAKDSAANQQPRLQQAWLQRFWLPKPALDKANLPQTQE